MKTENAIVMMNDAGDIRTNARGAEWLKPNGIPNGFDPGRIAVCSEAELKELRRESLRRQIMEAEAELERELEAEG